jgi:hypothetical protein
MLSSWRKKPDGKRLPLLPIPRQKATSFMQEHKKEEEQQRYTGRKEERKAISAKKKGAFRMNLNAPF